MNFSLVLIFLYVVVHFIIVVQRDVEHRIEEYRAGRYICILDFITADD